VSRARHRRLVVLAPLVVAAAVLSSCSGGDGDDVEASGSDTSTSVVSNTTLTPGDASTTSAPPATGGPDTTAPAGGRGAMGRYPERVYVPNTKSNSVEVIDPATCAVEKTLPVGHVPHHITPSYDLDELYVFNTESNSLSVIDPATGDLAGEIEVEDPYNLYFTPDGASAIVVAERLRRLDFRDRETWELQASVTVEPPGVDHLAFSRDGGYLVASTEFSGFAVKVDLATCEIVGMLEVGGAPIDVLRDPHDDPVMYIANQASHGVHVLDTESMTEIGFIPTGKGAHGLLLSKDKSQVYVSNRLEGTISVIDLAARQVVATWNTGGSPDMGLLNPAGDTMWIANRYHASVMAIDTATGEVRCRIPSGSGPHGLTYFPTPGVHSIGHNGLMIDENGEIE
jgi:YVTN family beta-propeller protein